MSRSIEPSKACHTRIGRAGILVRSLIHLANVIGVEKEDHIITSGVELQTVTLLVDGIGAGEESLTQGIEKAEVELLTLILLVTPNKMRENTRRKGITKIIRLRLILVIMHTRKDTNLVIEDRLIKTEAQSILDTTSTEEKIMHDIHEYEQHGYMTGNEGKFREEERFFLQIMDV